MKHDELINMMNVLVSSVKRESFVDGYEATDKEAFALIMSKYFQWNGYEITKAAVEALRDANFRELADNVEKELNKELANG